MQSQKYLKLSVVNMVSFEALLLGNVVWLLLYKIFGVGVRVNWGVSALAPPLCINHSITILT